MKGNRKSSFTPAARFGLRLSVCFTVLAAMMLFAAVRVGVVAASDRYKKAAAEQSSYSLKLYSCRGNIYDCRMRRLTGRTYMRSCVLPPNDSGITAATELLSGERLSAAIERLISGFPSTAPIGDRELPLGTVEYFAPIRYSDSLCCHLLGYINRDGNGVCGVEKAFDSVLFSSGFTRAVFALSATNDILAGVDGVIDEGSSGGDVVLTVDRNIQIATEGAMRGVKKGAAVVLDADNGKIRAMCSLPSFTGDDAASRLNDDTAPLVNRAVSNYGVGSVFKLCVAAAAIENGIDPSLTFVCNGSYTTPSGRVFSCHEKKGHGVIDMKNAVAESCNVYFYNLAAKLGGEKILETAKRCGFSSSADIDGCVKLPSGRLPSSKDLFSDAALCNFAIGQGDLLLSPLAVANMYAAIASGGIYYTPRLVEATIKDGKREAFGDGNGVVNRVIDSECASKLKGFLEYAVANGTGRRAKPTMTASAAGGKTATVQTGVKINGKEILNGWYCGFIEKGGKRYVICVVREDVTSGASDCAPIFSKIADGILSCDRLPD